jgi:hypothetical protein
MKIIAEDIKIHKLYRGNYSIGNYEHKFLIKTNEYDFKLGYIAGGDITNDKIKVNIDYKNIYLTKENILLIPYNYVTIDLKNKKIYTSDKHTFDIFLQSVLGVMSKRTSIILSNSL